MSEIIEQQSVEKQTLDLSDWWVQVDFGDIEALMNKKSMWKFWWLTQDKTKIITMEDWHPESYNSSNTIIKLRDFSKEDTVDATRKNLLSALNTDSITTFDLDWDNFVSNRKEAEEKAKETGKKRFWYIKDKYTLDWKTKKERCIVELDFSEDINKPKITKHPLKTYIPKKIEKI